VTAPRVFLSAGEASGDMHGANLARELAALSPGVRLDGIGSDQMRAAGVDVHMDIKGLAITGIAEVFFRIPQVLAAFRRMVAVLEQTRPSVVVLIDSPELNIRLARKAHQLGIPIVYYISPQVWAWRKYRVRELARLVKKMLVILPFEADVYREAGVDVEFVGHPLLDQPMATRGPDELRPELGLGGEGPVVALLPGSRNNELERMGPVLAETAALLHQRVPGVRTVVPLARTIPEERAHAIFARSPQTRLVAGRTYDVIAAADAALACAGTVTLECALIGTPLAVLYKISPITYHIARFLVSVDHISLVNLIARRRVVPEYVQGEASAPALAECLERMVRDPETLARMRGELAGVRTLLGEPGASTRAAKAVMPFLS
jgi:lipid-A-disaccharide synthase